MLDALQDQESIERRDRRAHVAQRHDAGAADVGGGAEGFGIDDPMVRDVRLVQPPEPVLVVGPREPARIDDDAAMPPSIAATRFSSTSWVGFMMRV